MSEDLYIPLKLNEEIVELAIPASENYLLCKLRNDDEFTVQYVIDLANNGLLSLTGPLQSIHRIEGENEVQIYPQEQNQINNEEHTQTKWCDSGTKLLLSLYPVYRSKVENRQLKSFEKMWEEMANKFQENGYPFTTLQIKNKFRTMERQWKKKNENNNQTGRGRITCPYENELDDIFKKKSNVHPEILLTSRSDKMTSHNDGKKFVEVEPPGEKQIQQLSEDNINHGYNKNKKSITTTTIIEKFRQNYLDIQNRRAEEKKTRDENRERRHQENMEYRKEVSKRKLDLLEKYLEGKKRKLE